MKRNYDKYLVLKKRIIEEIQQNKPTQIKELAAYSYQLKEILDNLKQIALEDQFTSQKKRKQFYEVEVIQTLTYYWYVRELCFLNLESPLFFEPKDGKLEDALSSYALLQKKYFEVYSRYCAKGCWVESEQVRSYLLQANEKSDWTFFDEEKPCLLPIYFWTLGLISTELLRLHSTNTKRDDPLIGLTWNGSKLDLIVIVYTLYYFSKEKGSVTTIIEWSKRFEQLFNIEISKNFHQTLSEFRKKKNIEDTVLLKMHQIIVQRFSESE